MNNARSLMGVLALVVLGLLVWELRWVLLVLFGAVVVAVALDVPTTLLRRLLRLNRAMALSLVVALLLVIGGFLIMLLLPEVVVQIQQLGQLIPVLLVRLSLKQVKLKFFLNNQHPLKIAKKLKKRP